MKGRECELARRMGDWLSNDEEHLKFVFGHEVQDEDLEEVQRASGQVVKGILHQKNFYRLNLIFWIVMGCGIASFGRRGLKTTGT